LPVFPVLAPAPVFPVSAPTPVFPADEEPEPEVSVVPVLVVVEVEVVPAGTVLVGTVSVGAPAVSACGEPPPQAETPTAMATPADRAATELVMRARREVTTKTSASERIHPTSAMGAVVQVFLSELVAPIAEAEVLDRPGKLRRRRSQGKEDGHGLHRLAGLPVHVGPPRLRLDDHLATGRGRPQAILLIDPHGFDATSGPLPRHHRRSLG
jgi:hypothetical protein